MGRDGRCRPSHAAKGVQKTVMDQQPAVGGHLLGSMEQVRLGYLAPDETAFDVYCRFKDTALRTAFPPLEKVSIRGLQFAPSSSRQLTADSWRGRGVPWTARSDCG
jgi:hypothetical protein